MNKKWLIYIAVFYAGAVIAPKLPIKLPGV